MIKLLKFYKEIRAGSSLPLIVGGDNGVKYVVKLRESGEGILANFVEWMSNKLGQLLQIPLLEPEFLMVDQEFAQEAEDPEIVELIERSVGINFGTQYKEDTSSYNEEDCFAIDKALKNNIFLYDLFLLNIDRNSKNPNMIFSKNQLWCLDYSSSITMRSCLNGKTYQERGFWQHVKRHPFYNDKINPQSFIERFKNVEEGDICSIVEQLPEEWVQLLNGRRETVETRRVIKNRLIEKKNNVKTLKRGLKELKDLRIETEDEERSRVLKNKETFELKFGKL